MTEQEKLARTVRRVIECAIYAGGIIVAFSVVQFVWEALT